ncbi:MAG: DUF3786 domain-containing protein [Oscillospiraceae bacterium]|nr:DUF3786 domain-containing protein [Oscillospiraceae bacterium]
MIERRNNYEETKKRSQAVFLEYDQLRMIERLALDADERWISFPFMGSACRVDRKTGLVERADVITGEYAEADFNSAMTVYDLLCGSSEDAAPSGEFVAMGSLCAMHSAAAVFGEGSSFRRQAQAFDRDPDKLKAALKALGAVLVAGGDVCGEISVFGKLKVMVRFWRSDEDFPAQLQLLWDKNVLSYMHYETVWYANGAIVNDLVRASGIDE